MRFTRPVLPALAAAGLLVATLAGCSTPEKGDPGDAALSCPAAGDASKAVKVKVADGADTAPKVTFDAPLKTDATQASVIKAGTGAKITEKDNVKVRFTFVNGTTGKALGATGYEGSAVETLPMTNTQVPAGLRKAVLCAKPGAIIAAVIPPDDGFGATGAGELKADDVLVAVADVVSIVKDKADGKSVDPGAEFPKVTLKKSGEPEVDLPKTVVEPATTLIGQLKQGDGATVAAGDTVTVQYKGIDWNTGKVFDASWTRGQSSSFPTTGVIAGFSKALVGQKVGSQVIAIIPPAEGYGPSGGQPSAGIAATDTLIFVVDILDTGATASTQG
ncbi:FKBP-type peptidyl-prolyl cis-trans isomerase [Schumannella soli]|uniref:peptidylprolyl isomerase n=1 Tax=Schumannella soli TaxID=2590779 RepID=A0A506Y346_9MICO|nr:FKBP-type peptidyl-prolyl cis-trans isomerase [Schumannella soli]TPW76010.1 peptidylprolyl isomerase [Schumannella soli]